MKGILMKPDMIAASVEGRKTNTRRADASLREINLNPDIWEFMRVQDDGNFLFWKKSEYASAQLQDPKNIKLVKPRYGVGETVYIKEAWAVIKLLDNVKPRDIKPRNYRPIWYQDSPVYSQLSPWPEGNRGRWRSPLFMPAWAARHFVLIEAVRAERLQEISIEDVLSEGISFTGEGNEIEALWQFIDLWDSINPAYPFDIDPWVWVYKFSLAKARR